MYFAMTWGLGKVTGQTNSSTIEANPNGGITTVVLNDGNAYYHLMWHVFSVIGQCSNQLHLS